MIEERGAHAFQDMKFVTIDPLGLPTAFYDRAIHGKAIPAEALEITDADWMDALDNQGLRRFADNADGTATVVPYDPPPPPPAELKAAATQEASRRILATLPDWRQRNMLARSAELLRKGEANLNADEAAEVAGMDALWQWVKSVRSFSNQLEADIDGGLLRTVDEVASAAWPPAPA